MPLLVIISGPPCTGKTTLGQRIAAEFRLPYVSKDGIKETLFDSLGWNDRTWSQRLGAASSELLYYFVGVQLAAGRSCIAESNFPAAIATEHFLTLQQQYAFEPFQIQCYADPTVLLERSDARVLEGKRHPGHVPAVQRAELEAVFAAMPPQERGRYEPIDIGGVLYNLDTTDFTKLDVTSIFAAIREALERE